MNITKNIAYFECFSYVDKSVDIFRTTLYSAGQYTGFHGPPAQIGNGIVEPMEKHGALP